MLKVDVAIHQAFVEQFTQVLEQKGHGDYETITSDLQRSYGIDGPVESHLWCHILREAVDAGLVAAITARDAGPDRDA